MAGETLPVSSTPARERLLRAGVEGLIAGLVMFGLSVPIIAWRTQTDPNNTLVLASRWPLVAISVATVFLARILTGLLADWRMRALAVVGAASIVWGMDRLSLGGAALIAGLGFVTVGAVCVVAASLIDARLARPARAPSRKPLESPGLARLARFSAAAGIACLFAFPLVTAHFLGSSGSLKWINNYGIQILIYVMLGWGLNIVVGLAGLLDLGYVAFYAVGAYSYALLSTVFGLSFWICLPMAGVFAACWGLILGFPVLRLRGDYLAIVTLAFGEIVRIVLINWSDLTNGYAGIASIPNVSFFGIPFVDAKNGFAARFGLPFSPIQRIIFLFYLILCLALLTNFVTLRLRRLPIGRAWEALREDEIACRSLGVNTVNTKLTAFALGAMFGGFAGSFFAVRESFVSPDSFTFIESATILAIVVLGGMGSQIGVALAAVVMIGGTEILRELDFLKRIFGHNFDPAQYRMLIFGFAMVLMMIWKPRGLISTRRPSIFLRPRKAVPAAKGAEGRA
ncbi:MAG TPA: high-affinity branched-chain amino acid ABC transporter permease LivM [Beijerinckiaceae bacterium]|nr:high-affinity branched-chain amino acid ABC transporter permease LivM [Beijerinckiaceae bacterium]